MKDEFAVVLLDVSMPGMDGFETAALIHEHPRFEKHADHFRHRRARSPSSIGSRATSSARSTTCRAGRAGDPAQQGRGAGRAVLPAPRAAAAQSQRSREANAQLELANTTLQAEKTRELEALNQHLQNANAELAATNRALQAKMAERARAEAALSEADRHKDEFLAMLAHELRNPLAPIRNAVEIMRKRQSTTRSSTWARDVIERQAKHLDAAGRRSARCLAHHAAARSI